MFQPKHLLVTGSAGFIGSHFVCNMIDKYPDIQILSVDKITYSGSREHLSGLDPARHRLIIADITHADLIDTMLRKYSIDTIVHFAAESHVDRSIASPSEFVKTNVVGTFVLLEAARQYWLTECRWTDKQCRFHHVSTDEVYGSLDNDSPAFSETHPYQPNSPYSATKAASDHFVRAYHHTYSLPVTISNCSNNYGPHQHNEKLIPKVIQACLEGRTIPLYGSGLNIRDWLYVEDHVEAIDCIVKSGTVGSTYHVGGSAEKTNLEVVEAICEWMDHHYPNGSSYKKLITLVPDRLGHDWRYAMNTDKIRDELGWVPKTAFAKGLARTLSYYIKLYSKPTVIM